MENALDSARLMYTATIRFTGEKSYGIEMAEIFSGSEPMPPAGARFDQTFEGELSGPEITGKLTGTDYLYLRPDGSLQLHLHGRIETPDGAAIALASTGVSLHDEGSPEARLRAAVSLFSNHAEYTWLNRVQLWAAGTMNPLEGTAVITAYLA